VPLTEFANKQNTLKFIAFRDVTHLRRNLTPLCYRLEGLFTIDSVQYVAVNTELDKVQTDAPTSCKT